MELSKSEFEQIIKQYFRSTRTDKNEAWARVYTEMSVHINGVIPERLIRSRRPKEDEERYTYRVANYEPITKGVIRESINSLFRIFNESNYDIKASREVETFINKPIFNSMKLMSWIQSQGIFDMILDPNAIIAVTPTGKGITDPFVKIEPRTELVCSYNIREYTDELVIYLSKDKSLVQYYNNLVSDGSVYVCMTKTHVYRLIQVGKKSDLDYQLDYAYAHNMGYVPCLTLGGEYNSELGVYESFFSSFLPFANEAIRQYSDWQGTMVTTAYPHKIVDPIECSAEGCINGYLYGDKSHKCNSCKGTGLVAPSSPYGVYVRPAINEALGDKMNTRPPIEFIAPDTAIIKLMQEAWEALLNKAMETIHLDPGGEGQSGNAKAIDREREYAMILKISNNIFDNIVYRLLWFFEQYINPQKPQDPMVIKPSGFQLKTEGDLASELVRLKGSGTSVHVIREIYKEFIKRRYAGNTCIYNYHLFLLEYDVLYPYSIQEKLSMFASGVITKETVVKSIYSSTLLDRVLRTENSEYEVPPITPEYFKTLAKLVDKQFEELYVEMEREFNIAIGLPPNAKGNGNPLGNLPSEGSGASQNGGRKTVTYVDGLPGGLVDGQATT